MADLELVVGTGSVLDALNQIGRLEGQVKALTDRFIRGSADQKTYSRGLLEIKRQYQALGMSSQKASGQVDKLSRGFRDNSKEIDRLRAKYNPLYASSKQYERAIEEINHANKIGALNDKQRQASLAQLHREYATGTGQFAQYTAMAAGRMNQMGVVTQQAGYQIGDFLVQVQSGTNAFVAFGQQATQLVGILPMMGAGFMGLSQKALIGLSAGLGIAIPLVTALAAAFMRTREEAEPTESVLDRLSTSITNVRSAMEIAESSASDLADRYGELGDEVAIYARRVAEFEMAFAAAAFQDQASAIRDMSSAYTEATVNFVEGIGRVEDFSDANRRLVEDFGLVGAEVNLVRNALDALSEAETIEGQTEAANNFYAVLESLNIPISAIPEQLARGLQEMDSLYIKTAEWKELLDKIGKGEKTSEDSGGGGGERDGIGGLARSLMTQQEQIDAWRTESLEKMQEFNALELEILGGHAEARARIEEEYQNRIRELREQQYQGVVDSQKAAQSAFLGLLGTLGQKSQTAAKLLIAINTGLSIAQAIQNTAVAATRALAELGPVAGAAAAAKIKAFGAAQVALIAANGALRLGSAGASGAGGGSIGSGGDVAAPVAAAAPEPQQVIIEGIDRDSLISGEQLSKLFDRLYEENDERGIVFSVAR